MLKEYARLECDKLCSSANEMLLLPKYRNYSIEELLEEQGLLDYYLELLYESQRGIEDL